MRLRIISALPVIAFLLSPDPAFSQPQPAAAYEVPVQAPGDNTVTEGVSAPEPAPATSGMAAPTAAGGKGGATTYTQNMPLDRASLVELRKQQLGTPEFRGAWITRFDWVIRSAGELNVPGTKKRIIQFMDDAVAINLNAVIFQVRADATTMYPSKLEPWSQMVGGKDPGFDPLQFALDEAHKRKLEFHAYVNPVPCTEEKADAPQSKDHIWYKHCLPNSSPNWLVYQDGKIAPYTEYRWFNTNLPEVQAYIRWIMTDLAQRYELDGMHFDRIRLPSANVSDDPWSKARFASGDANPDKLPYNQWQADNISRMLTDIYGVVTTIRPAMKITSSVWGIYDKSKLPPGTDRKTGYGWVSSGLQNYHQDSIRWINDGSMDALVPMIYWNMGDVKPDYDELALSFTSSIKNGRHLYGGQRIFDDTEMVRQAVATRLLGAQGTVPFTLNRLRERDLLTFYRSSINPTPAALPEMPWKTRPEGGTALVTVKDSAGKPVTDAQVRASGTGRIALSSLDGFCSILNLAPGSHSISAGKAGASGTTTIVIAAGKGTRAEITLQ